MFVLRFLWNYGLAQLYFRSIQGIWSNEIL